MRSKQVHSSFFHPAATVTLLQILRKFLFVHYHIRLSFNFTAHNSDVSFNPHVMQ